MRKWNLALVLLLALCMVFFIGCDNDDEDIDGDTIDGDVTDGDVELDGDTDGDIVDGDDETDGDTSDGDVELDGDETDGDTDGDDVDGDETEDDTTDGDDIDGDETEDDTTDGDDDVTENENANPDPTWAGDDFEDENIDDWAAMDQSFLTSVDNTTAANSTQFSLELEKTEVGTNGLERRFDEMTPCEISYYTYTAECPTDGYQNHFILSQPNDEDAFVGDIAWIHIEATGGANDGLVFSAGAVKTKLADCIADHWYYIVLRPDWTAKTISVEVDGTDKGTVDFKDANATAASRLELFGSTTGLKGRWDEIEFKTNCQ